MIAVAVGLVPRFAFGDALHPSFYHHARMYAAAAADAAVPSGVTVEAVNSLGPQLSGRDTVLLWDGDGKTPRFAPVGGRRREATGVHLPLGSGPAAPGRPPREPRLPGDLPAQGLRRAARARGGPVIAAARTTLADSARRAGRGLITSPAGPAEQADPAGLVLTRLTVLPALLVMAWLLAGLPLLLLGVFTPVLMLLLATPLAVLLAAAGLRWIPGLRPGPGAEPPDPAEQPDLTAAPARTPWWTVAAVIAIAIAFGADQLIYHAQQLIVMRDPAAYIQFGNWIAAHGSLPIPQDRAAFGGTHHLLTFDSFASYQIGGVVVPQFMAGLPMLLAGGFWVGGAAAATAMAPVLGTLAVLTFGGLAARLIGPRWAPLAALLLAITLPMQFTSRSTYSEPTAAILFLGGLCLVIDSLRTDGRASRIAAALGGLALGLTLLVRVDGASDILPVIPYAGLLLISRRPQALPLTGGLIVGGLYGAVDGLFLSWPYLASIKSSLIPLALLTAVVVLATAVTVLLLRRRGLPAIRGNVLPNAAAVLAFAITIGFALRPYVQTVHAALNAPTRAAMTIWQRADHLPIQPTRLYYEISLRWVFWYLGVPAVVLATIGAALLARRCLRGRAPLWTLPLITFAWTIVITLYRPAIVPDQPWASRRLVPAVLPGFILLAVWTVRWLGGWLREQGLRPGRPGRRHGLVRGRPGRPGRADHARPRRQGRRPAGPESDRVRAGLHLHLPRRGPRGRRPVRGHPA